MIGCEAKCESESDSYRRNKKHGSPRSQRTGDGAVVSRGVADASPGARVAVERGGDHLNARLASSRLDSSAPYVVVVVARGPPPALLLDDDDLRRTSRRRRRLGDGRGARAARADRGEDQAVLRVGSRVPRRTVPTLGSPRPRTPPGRDDDAFIFRHPKPNNAPPTPRSRPSHPGPRDCTAPRRTPTSPRSMWRSPDPSPP